MRLSVNGTKVALAIIAILTVYLVLAIYHAQQLTSSRNLMGIENHTLHQEIKQKDEYIKQLKFEIEWLEEQTSVE